MPSKALPRYAHYRSRKPSSKNVAFPQDSWHARLRTLLHNKFYAALLAVGGLALIAIVIWQIVRATRPHRPGLHLDALKSDLTVLYDNNLSGNQSYGALVISNPVVEQDGQDNCSSLGEDLFDVRINNPANLTRYLSYLDNTTSDELYWVNGQIGKPSKLCSAANRQGTVVPLDCATKLSVLCTHSAPLPDVNTRDASTRWRITVPTGEQSYTGIRDARGFQFIGIRYAAQPTRFVHSTPFTNPGQYPALAPGSLCTQPGGQGSEDCLFLNVYTPYLPKTNETEPQLKPVIFSIHGGAFEIGGSTGGTGDAGNMASRGDVVVVSCNYRLGTLGFLALNDTVTTGNFGLGDQLTALEWVHDHIRDFGGNPSRITILGQSAGAASVRAMLGSPRAIGNFSAAVMQSNLGGYNFAASYSKYYNISTVMSEFAVPVLQQTGCFGAKSQVKCLRGLSDHKLADLDVKAEYLVVDNELIVADHLVLNGTGPVAHVPVLLGTMEDDGVFFVGNEDDSFGQNLTKYLGDLSWNTSVVSHAADFPIVNVTGNDTLNTYAAFARSATDAMFRCADQATAAASTNHENVFRDVWYFEFGRAYTNYGGKPQCQPPATDQYPSGDPSAQYYKCHSGDVPYVFGNIGYMHWADRDGKDILFSQIVTDMWTQFAWRGDPNPDEAYLEARGYTGTLDAVRGAGRWDPVGTPEKKLGMRVLDANMTDSDFKDVDQCADINLPLNYYDQ